MLQMSRKLVSSLLVLALVAPVVMGKPAQERPLVQKVWAKVVQRQQKSQDEKNKALFEAIRVNDYATFIKLLDEGVDFVTARYQNETPIVRAARLEHAKMVKELLRRDVNDRITSHDKVVAMVSTMTWRYGNDAERAEILEMLMHEIVRHHDLAKTYEPNLWETAVVYGDLPYLLRETDVRQLVGYNGGTLLHTAVVKAGHEAVSQVANTLRDTRDRGAFANTPDQDGLTPLMLAITLWKDKHVEALLNAGASVWETDKNGKTALDYAFALSVEKEVAAESYERAKAAMRRDLPKTRAHIVDLIRKARFNTQR